MADAVSALNPPVVSDERIRDTLRRHIERALKVDKRFTRTSLANEAGVKVHAIDAIITMGVDKQRRVTMEDAFSLAFVLGPRAVQSLLALIGWTGHALEDEGELQPMLLAATAMQHLSTIATAAADGRIDHIEEPACREAADFIIAIVKPLSSVGRQA